MDNIQTDLNRRVDAGISRGNPISVKVNGIDLKAYAGESIGAVLTAAGIRKVRSAPHSQDPRGLYCCTGMCHGCLVTVNGKPNIRACVTPVEPGVEIILQEGFGRFKGDDNPLPQPGLKRHQVPVVVIGGGPAGLSAAVAAAKQGARVLVIDENRQAGGQIYRQMPDTFSVEQASLMGSDYKQGQALLKEAGDLDPAITIWNDALVWSVFDSNQLAVERNHTLWLIDAGAVVVATGAMERPFPVPGWTLPGVMTVGGAQTLLKSQRVLPGSRVLLAGTGPLLLVVANQMLEAGIDIAAVVESSSGRFSPKHLFPLLRQPDLLLRGISYIAKLKRAGVPYIKSSVLARIEGTGSVERALIETLDGRGDRIHDLQKGFDVDTVCIGYGLLSATWLTHMFGCSHTYNALFCGWVPVLNETMETDKKGIFAAGDGAGVAGVIAAVEEGKIAGTHAALHAGSGSRADADTAVRGARKKLDSFRLFRRAIDTVYRLDPRLYGHIPDETLICRCEGISAGEIREVARNGTLNPNDIKKRSRAGMGYCQGTNCLPSIAMILINEFGVEPGAFPWMTTRPPARPIPMDLLMSAGDP